MKNILVTGGAGYIGSHTCKMLKKTGYVPVSYDNLVYGHRSAVQWGPFEEGDILDSARLDEVFCTYNPDAVIHFAAFGYVGESVVDPAKYYTNNVTGTINLLNAMRRASCNKIIFSSTCATFGVPESVPIIEENPQKPVNPYGRSKLMIEQVLADYDKAYKIKHVALRYFNAAGADPDGEIGEDHTPETHLIPIVLETALGKRDKIIVYGNDYSTSDGTAVRDYIHVTDLADAHVKSLDLLEKTGESDQFNLGSETGTSVKKIIEQAEGICRVTVPFEYGARRDGDPPLLVAKAEKAKKILGWKTAYSDITTILKTAYAWHRHK